jgi:hypothetical protein
MKKLMTVFQEFFQEHSERWIERFDDEGSRPAASVEIVKCFSQIMP